MNEEYWKSFYNNSLSLEESSNFSNFVLSHLQPGESLLDLGCGNGKDTVHFLKNNIKAVGVDLNTDLEGKDFITGSVLENIKISDNYYMRFFVHAVEESYLDQIIDKISDIAPGGSKIFIETRSTTGVIERKKHLFSFTSGVGEEHTRMLYSLEYLSKKIEKKFKVLYESEEYGYSPFAGEDPCLIRIIAKKEGENR